MPTFTDYPPLGLYVHLPWCARKCPYCDFNSHAAQNFDEMAYISRLAEDLQQEVSRVWGRQVSSIFIGGGTPSLFSGKAIDRLMSNLRACLNISPAAEITLEANPGSSDESHFEAYLKAGINRFSIGIQSFNDACLQQLGRVHDRQAALSAITRARSAGCENLNLDLMFALPQQSLDMALTDLQQALDVEPEHLSHYQLTIEPNTLFHSRRPDNLPDDGLAWEMQQQCQEMLAAAGYHHYEVSAYAKSESLRSRHNLNYWQFGDYLGIGAGAHGKITLPADGQVLRRQKIRQPEQYLSTPTDQLASQQHTLEPSDLVFEFMLNALRLKQGFDPQLFVRHCGLGAGLLKPALELAETKQLLEVRPDRICPTELGWRFHNDLQGIFLDAPLGPENQIEVQPDFL